MNSELAVECTFRGCPGNRSGAQRLCFALSSIIGIAELRLKVLYEQGKYQVRNFLDDARSHLRQDSDDIHFRDAGDLSTTAFESARFAGHLHRRASAAFHVLT